MNARMRGASAPSAPSVVLPAAVALVAMVLSRVVTAWSSGCWDVAWTAAALAALAGMLMARGTAAPVNRVRWNLWAAAAACWFGGQLAWDVFGLTGFPSSPNLADLGWWGFAVIVMVSLFGSRSRSRSLRIVALVETLPVIAAAIALSLAELWHDAMVSSLTLAPKLSALVYPALYITAAVLLLQAMIGGSLRGSRSAALPLVLGGMAAQALAFWLWSTQLLAGTYVPGGSILDPLWAVGLVAIGAGGLLAARRPEETIEINEPARHGGVLPAAMFVLLIAALVNAQLTHAPSGVAITLGAGLLFSGATLIVRGTLLERRLRELLSRERASLATLGYREAELARLNTRLVEDSRHDPLTGMRNRRALADDLPQLETGQKEQGRSFALALCDIDHFKAYNDRLGHLAGDQALRTIAATVRGALRGGDIAYRFGGEELLLILRDVDADEAIAAAERVRAAVTHAAVPHPDGIGGVLTVSIGVACGEESSSTLMARADAALYDAKHAGRDCVLAAEDSDPSVAAGRRHGVMDEPVPRHLRSRLAVSRAAASGHGPIPVLQALAETIRSELSFHVVAVNLLDDARRELKCVIVLGDHDARGTLLGTVNPWGEWERLMGSEHRRCGAVWLPAGSHAWEDESQTWTPATPAAPGADSWQQDDMLLLPLRGQHGEILGVVSVDQPVSGRRPDDGQIAFLMAVTDYTGLALEQSQRDTAHSAAVLAQSAELRLAALMLLAETLDLRDPGTARHSRTVGAYARHTAVALGLPADRVERIHAAGVLHDLGKLGIADAILYKPAPLDAAEWHEIRRHPEIGARILDHAGLREIATWVRTHHERIDGHGYPRQLEGHEVALEARVLAVADAYEAMITDRPYRAGMSPAAARRELKRCAGSQFDPGVVDAFISTLRPDTRPAQTQARPAVHAARGTPATTG
ncbi:MAG: diguanylate cyclase [Actinomycetota bacterium]|nr:diguanylate cyclase [Actinomycetota bacterium]